MFEFDLLAAGVGDVEAGGDGVIEVQVVLVCSRDQALNQEFRFFNYLTSKRFTAQIKASYQMWMNKWKTSEKYLS